MAEKIVVSGTSEGGWMQIPKGNEGGGRGEDSEDNSLR